jgi:hypothetical protein
MAQAAGDVPGDVVEVAVFVDGVPAQGTALLRKRGERVFLNDVGDWTTDLGPAKEVPLDERGRAAFESLERGQYDVAVGGPSLGGHRFTTEVAGRGGAAHPRSVIALGHGAISGRAFAPDGKPAVGATVRFHGEEGAYAIRGMVAETRVDAEGRYALASLPAAHGLLMILFLPIDGFPQGYRELSVDVVDPPARTVDVGSAAPLPGWRGRVVEGDGSVAKGPGQLHVSDPTPRAGGPEWRLVVVRADGRFEARLPPGRLRVDGHLQASDGPPRTITPAEVVVPDGGLEQDLSVNSGSLEVRVVRSAIGAVSMVEVTLEPVGAERGTAYGTVSNRRGLARFGALPRGRYRVVVEKATVRTPDGGAPEIEIQDRPAFLDVELTSPTPGGTPR